ncbi:MAG TPA: NapC/NirT family cytochrome c [Candidatus Eisenbacteria bacterium]|nr:NapC/NirT family cytochrome c [Candidatus Eisenbacteria bacterium]
MPKPKKFSAYFYNPLTYFGVYLALLVFISECFLFAIDLSAHGRNLYLGLLTYIFLPPFLILGLLLIPAGAFWEKRRVAAGKSASEFRTLRIDLAVPQHRNMLFVFTVGTVILVMMTFAGLYKSFQYTESVEFCGTLCHKLMNPEYTAYLQSPHAKVKCVECHIGAGADWYLHSKLAGARQVVKAATNTYKSPIETPVRDLRPAQDICLECHSPGKKFSTYDFNRTYFLTGGGEPWKIRMQLNVGGGGGQSHGVHAHMNVDNDIYYAAEDDKRQKITWVKSVDKAGRETVYVAPGSKWAEAPPEPSRIRKMDCIDCHNRPTHRFRAPYRVINEAMESGAIDPAIPDVKQKAMEVLSGQYETDGQALSAIEKSLRDYYKEKHSDYYGAHSAELDKAIGTIRELYSHNMFPEMKVRWDTHPDNIGHFAAPGCFRCHDGEHKSVEEKVISQDCRACHRIVEQGPAGQTEKNPDGLEFKHPTDDEWQGASCTDCHTGGA